MSRAIDVHMRQGTTWRLQLTWRDSDGTPKNLTDASAELRTATPPGLTLEPEISPLAGRLVFALSPEQTAALAPVSRAAFLVDVTDDAGTVTELIAGTFTVRRDPTR